MANLCFESAQKVINRDGETAYFSSWNSVKVKAWLKSGELVIVHTAEDEKNDSDEVTTTISFDKGHVAHVMKSECSAVHYLTCGDDRESEGDHDGAIVAYTKAIEWMASRRKPT